MEMREKIRTEVFVLGGGLSGIAAAVGAARCGVSVAMAERSSVLGGTATQALVNPWQTFHSPEGRVIGGIAQELTCRLMARGATPGHIPDPVGFVNSVTPVDPDALKLLLAEIVAEEKIALLLGHRFREVRASGGRISGVVLEDDFNRPVLVEAETYIDASGNGDLTAAAGCDMEIDAGAQPMTLIFVLGGVDFDAVESYQESHPDEFYMSPDTKAVHNGYIGVSGFFRHVREAREQGRLDVPRDRVLFFGNNRPGQVVVNTTRVTGYHGIYGREVSRAMQEGLAQVLNLFEFMRSDLPGFANAEMVRIADHIGVRETRRLLGRYVMNERDILSNQNFDDAVAKGAYPLDIHSSDDDSLSTEIIGGKGHYDIPLRSLLNNSVENLVTVGKCISVTHVGFSSTRVMPTCMAVGQAGGVAAAYSVIKKRDPEELSAEIRDRLRDRGAIILDQDVARESL